MKFPVISHNLCGLQKNLQRQNIKSAHLLDGNLFDFKNMQLGAVVEEGDIAFDD